MNDKNPPSYEELFTNSENYYYGEYISDQKKYKSKLIKYVQWNWNKKNTSYKKYNFLKRVFTKTEHFYCDPTITKTYSKIRYHPFWGDHKFIYCYNCNNKLISYDLNFGY